jgi:hypothetical protein
MTAMNALRKLLLTVGASGAALALAVGPVAADEAEPAEETPAEEPAEVEADDEAEVEADDEADDENGKIALAETPRDRIGLILLGALLAGGWFASTNARRQLKGERPQASGEFRWR